MFEQQDNLLVHPFVVSSAGWHTSGAGVGVGVGVAVGKQGESTICSPHAGTTSRSIGSTAITIASTTSRPANCLDKKSRVLLRSKR